MGFTAAVIHWKTVSGESPTLDLFDVITSCGWVAAPVQSRNLHGMLLATV